MSQTWGYCQKRRDGANYAEFYHGANPMFGKSKHVKQPKTMISGVSAGDLKGRGEGPKSAPKHTSSSRELPTLYTDSRRGRTEDYSVINRGRSS